MIELFCPVFCDEPTFAAEQSSPPTLERNFAEGSNNQTEESISASRQLAQNNQQTICNDECFCHATAIPNLIIPPKEPALFNSERISFRFGEPVYNSLPPPYHPPKLS
ncbi:MAG: hypothetical protein LH472_01690 [Pyrinomonadaceae bacterium]|nr:hypothetical protein [Pyrinomonadaceae bacterium]